MSLVSGSIQKSIGSSRVLTYEFKKLRKTSTPRKRFQLEVDISPFRGSEKLLEELDPIEKLKPAFPPLWVDTYDKIIEEMGKLKESMTLLETLQQKKIVNPFSSNTGSFSSSSSFGKGSNSNDNLDSRIKFTSDSVYNTIKFIDSQIKDLRNHEGTSEDKNIRNNIITSLSTKLKDMTLRYKKKQEIYVAKIAPAAPKNLLEYESNEISLEDDDFGDNKQEIAKYRNEEINSLVSNVVDLADIFKELNSLVVTQGTILDRIDYNIQMTLEHTIKANKELVKAEKYQKCTRAAGCILLLVIFIIVLLIILALKIYL
ncbi:hypothetical protein SteCoe_33585 [Stentor coeruleus]|uniref:t-SNARE coiled-coil homology domain-containing protein n=1 Tax=Stentor coeruleus TaxID=5963 RepID=A0A1R2AWG1_9CILI|nr:hypothetical protein SteCoe_33585 [Stentor coeruleus]